MGETFVKYAGAGAIGTAAHYAVLIGLVEISRLQPVIAAACGAASGAAVNYILNYRYTFRSNADHLLSMPRFAVVTSVGVAINSLVVFLCIRWGAHYVLAQGMATLLVLLIGYLANSFWTFAGKDDDESKAS
jgi:putative flippase GtrA